MNGRILMGFGVAIGVWGAVAAVAYERVTGIMLIAAGVALIVIGQRNSKAG